MTEKEFHNVSNHLSDILFRMEQCFIEVNNLGASQEMLGSMRECYKTIAEINDRITGQIKINQISEKEEDGKK